MRATSEFRILQDGLQRFRPFLVQNLTYAWDDLRYYAARTALLVRMLYSGTKEADARKILNASTPNESEEISDLVKQIGRLPHEERWFIIPTEIVNSPRVLRTWHDYFILSKLI